MADKPTSSTKPTGETKGRLGETVAGLLNSLGAGGDILGLLLSGGGAFQSFLDAQRARQDPTLPAIGNILGEQFARSVSGQGAFSGIQDLAREQLLGQLGTDPGQQTNDLLSLLSAQQGPGVASLDTLVSGTGLPGFQATPTGAGPIQTGISTDTSAFRAPPPLNVQGPLSGQGREPLVIPTQQPPGNAFQDFLNNLGGQGGTAQGNSADRFGLDDSRARSKAIPGFQAGTLNAPGGLAVVGEQGPELLNLAQGSQVLPLQGGGQIPPSGPNPLGIAGGPKTGQTPLGFGGFSGGVSELTTDIDPNQRARTEAIRAQGFQPPSRQGQSVPPGVLPAQQPQQTQAGQNPGFNAAATALGGGPLPIAAQTPAIPVSPFNQTATTAPATQPQPQQAAAANPNPLVQSQTLLNQAAGNTGAFNAGLAGTAQAGVTAGQVTTPGAGQATEQLTALGQSANLGANAPGSQFATQGLEGLSGLAASGGPINPEVLRLQALQTRDTQSQLLQNQLRGIRGQAGARGAGDSGQQQFLELQANLGAQGNITEADRANQIAAAQQNFGAQLAANQALQTGGLAQGQFGLAQTGLGAGIAGQLGQLGLERGQFGLEQAGLQGQLAGQLGQLGLAGQSTQAGIADLLNQAGVRTGQLGLEQQRFGQDVFTEQRGFEAASAQQQFENTQAARTQVQDILGQIAGFEGLGQAEQQQIFDQLMRSLSLGFGNAPPAGGVTVNV